MGRAQRHAPPDPATELRELIREAHAATRDLSRLLRDVRQILPATAQEIVDKAMEARVNAEMARLNEFLQAEAVRVSRQMESEMTKAREWMISNLELIAITETTEGLRAEFNRKPMD